MQHKDMQKVGNAYGEEYTRCCIIKCEGDSLAGRALRKDPDTVEIIQTVLAVPPAAHVAVVCQRVGNYYPKVLLRVPVLRSRIGDGNPFRRHLPPADIHGEPLRMGQAVGPYPVGCRLGFGRGSRGGGRYCGRNTGRFRGRNAARGPLLPRRPHHRPAGGYHRQAQGEKDGFEPHLLLR